MTDQLALIGEARWSNEDREIDSGQTCTAAGPYLNMRSRREISTKSLTPRFIARFQPSDDTNFYASVAKGDKPAEFVEPYYQPTVDPCFTLGAVANDGPTIIEAEKNWTYELGTKVTRMNNRLTASLAVFFINWTNQAVTKTEDINGVPTLINVNAGKSKVWGAELETNMDFTDNLSGQFSYGLANGTIVKHFNESLASTTGDLSPNNAKGKRIPDAPKHSLIFGVTYRNEVALNLLEGQRNIDWFARTDFVWETQRYTSVNNLTKFPVRKLWNGRVGLDEDAWTLTAYVNNILDDATPTTIFGLPAITGSTWTNGNGVGQNSVSPAFGRAYGVEWIYRFGD